MQIADPHAFSLSGRNEPKSRNRRSRHLNSLKKLVLSMYFLETNDVVVVKEFFEIFEFEFSVPVSGENRSNKPPGVLCLTSTLSPAKGYRSWKSTSLLFAAGDIWRKRGSGRIGSAKRLYRPLQGHGSYWEACCISERECRRTCEVEILC